MLCLLAGKIVTSTYATIGNMNVALLLPALALNAALLIPGHATAQVKVLISGGFSGPYEQLVPQFERDTGLKITTASGASQGDGPQTIKAQLERGAPTDVVILSRQGLAELIAAGRIAAGSDTDLARTLLGVAVRAGAPKPNVATVEDFKALMLRSRAVSVPASTSGIFLARDVLPRLGLAGRVNLKQMPRGAEAAALVASGDADVAVMPVSEIAHAPGVELAGVLAPEIQLDQVFSAAVTSNATEPQAARRLIAFLTSARAAPVMRAGGMEPAGLTRFALEQEVHIGGVGGWDYLTFDSATKRLFISRGDRVQVWSASTQQIVGEISPTDGVHGIALAPRLGRGFTSNGKSNTVTVFDLASLKVLASVPVPGVNPDAILYEPVFNRVYAFNGRSRDAVIIDASSLKVIANIPLGGKPEFGVSDASGRVFVNIEDTAEIVAIDPASQRVAARWPLAPCEEPTGLAIDAQHLRLFATCANKRMAVVDANTGVLLAQVPIDAGPDAAAFDPGIGAVWSSNGAGTLTMVRPDANGRYEAAATVATSPRARTLAIDAATHRVYLVTAKFGDGPRPPMVPDSFEILVVGPQ